MLDFISYASESFMVNGMFPALLPPLWLGPGHGPLHTEHAHSAGTVTDTE
jgi:hypothetical protein